MGYVHSKPMAMVKFCLLTVALFTPVISNSWGFHAHKTINRAAVFTLPSEMFLFYKTHLDKIEQWAVKPDMRRYIDINEAPRHYLDVDFYETALPLDTIPWRWADAVAKYSLDTLQAHGIVPWHILLMKARLTEAFAKMDFEQIIKLSADIGHYVGDLHVPLHTTHNYDGQLTNQRGIHGLWESRLVEVFENEKDLFVGKAHYVDNLQTLIWTCLSESYAAKDSVLNLELYATERVGEHKKYTFETRGSMIVKTYSLKFCESYEDLLDGMVERRMRSSILVLGSIWMTAWIDAGQPDLSAGCTLKLPHNVESDTLKLMGKMLGRDEGH